MRKGKNDPKINSTHKADFNYSVSNSVMKGPGFRLEVWFLLDKLIKAGALRLHVVSGHLIFS